MDAWLKTLVAAACVIVIAGGTQHFIGNGAEADELVATPRIIEKCEKEIAQFLTHRNELKETGMRYYAITISDCKAYGLVAPSKMNALAEMGLTPYIEAYEENPNVWRKS